MKIKRFKNKLHIILIMNQQFIVDMNKYDILADDDSSFMELCKGHLSKDTMYYPVFLTNGFVDMKFINSSGVMRVTRDANTKYINKLCMFDCNDVGFLFNIYKMKDRDDVYVLNYKGSSIYIRIDILPNSIKNSYFYKDGKRETRQVRV